MVQHYRDEDLSTDARAYIQSLTSPSTRDAAREYARMDTMSYQARMGPKLDELNAKLSVLIDQQGRGFLNRKTIGILALLGGGLSDVTVNWLTKVHLFGGPHA